MPAGGNRLDVQLVTPEPFSVPAHMVVVMPPTVSSNCATPVGIPAPGAAEDTVVE
jgi:hypothetical protein